ncbi:hypothetical protein Tco_1034409 [Tanacetum coccineum]
MERITPLDLLSMMKRQHAQSTAPSFLLRATSTITGDFFIIQNSTQLVRFAMLPRSLFSIQVPPHVHHLILPTNSLKSLVSGVVSRSTRAAHPL